MDSPVRHKAIISTARGCGFAGLAVLTAMLGFAHDPPAAMKFGGMCSLLTALVLMIKASRARLAPYKRTEIWLMLEESERPPAILAQLVIGSVRREVLLLFALAHGHFALAFFAAALIWRWLGATR